MEEFGVCLKHLRNQLLPFIMPDYVWRAEVNIDTAQTHGTSHRFFNVCQQPPASPVPHCLIDDVQHWLCGVINYIDNRRVVEVLVLAKGKFQVVWRLRVHLVRPAFACDSFKYRSYVGVNVIELQTLEEIETFFVLWVVKLLVKPLVLCVREEAVQKSIQANKVVAVEPFIFNVSLDCLWTRWFSRCLKKIPS